MFLQELNWLERIIKLRILFPEADLINFDLETFLQSFPHRKKNINDLPELDFNTTPPPIEDNDFKTYTEIIRKCGFEERLLLILALSVNIEPCFINKITDQYHFSEIIKKTSGFWQTTGLSSFEQSWLIPSGRFWIYLLSGTDLNKRIEIISKISNSEFDLITSGIVDLVSTEEIAPLYSGSLKINHSALVSFFKKDQIKVNKSKNNLKPEKP